MVPKVVCVDVGNIEVDGLWFDLRVDFRFAIQSCCECTIEAWLLKMTYHDGHSTMSENVNQVRA